MKRIALLVVICILLIILNIFPIRIPLIWLLFIGFYVGNSNNLILGGNPDITDNNIGEIGKCLSKDDVKQLKICIKDAKPNIRVLNDAIRTNKPNILTYLLDTRFIRNDIPDDLLKSDGIAPQPPFLPLF